MVKKMDTGFRELAQQVCEVTQPFLAMRGVKGATEFRTPLIKVSCKFKFVVWRNAQRKLALYCGETRPPLHSLSCGGQRIFCDERCGEMRRSETSTSCTTLIGSEIFPCLFPSSCYVCSCSALSESVLGSTSNLSGERNLLVRN